MAAKLRWARKGGDGPVLSHGFASPDTACRICPEGARLSLTVFVPGLGDDVVDGYYTYVPEAELRIQGFLDGLGRALDEGVPRGLSPQPYTCCYELVLRAALDPERTLRQTGEDLAALLVEFTGALIRNSSWLLGVHVHLLGFSAGGLVAIETASSLSRRVIDSQGSCSWKRPRPAVWCDHPMPDELEFGIDVVTIATPYQGAGVFAEFFADLSLAITGGEPAPFFTSIGALAFGGGERPACVCGFLAMVTGDRDESAGNQEPGSEVSGWQPSRQTLPQADHLGALAAALERPDLRQYLRPGCACF